MSVLISNTVLLDIYNAIVKNYNVLNLRVLLNPQGENSTANLVEGERENFYFQT